MNKINIEDVLKRANAIILSDFDEEDIFTTWIISRNNDKLITREEAAAISNCFATCPVVFVPEPEDSNEPDAKYTIDDLHEMDVVKLRDGTILWILLDENGDLGTYSICTDMEYDDMLDMYYENFTHRISRDKDIKAISKPKSKRDSVLLVERYRNAIVYDNGDAEYIRECHEAFNWIRVLD